MTQTAGDANQLVLVVTAIQNGTKQVTITARPGYSEQDWTLALAAAGVTDDYDDWDYFEPDGDESMVWTFTVPAQL